MITDRIGRQKLVINHNNDNFQEQIDVTKGKKIPSNTREGRNLHILRVAVV